MDSTDVNLNDANQTILQEKLVKMDERNDMRKRLESKRRKDRYELGSHAEQTDAFFKTFREQEKAIDLLLFQANEAGKMGENRTQLTMKLDDVFKIIENLKRHMTESAMFLTSFDNEQAKKDFQALQSKFSNLRDILLPKKKFGFNAKAKTEKNNVITNTDILSDQKSLILEKDFQDNAGIKTFEEKNGKECKLQSLVDLSDCGFRDRSGERLTLEGTDVNGKDISVISLSNCSVFLFGSPGSVYLHNVTDSTIICGPTTRSVFVSQCNNCTFYFACQQARIHDTHHTKFYIHVTCTAIIETCDHVAFGPYLLNYNDLEKDFQRSGLNNEINNWAKVEDFCHLSLTSPSPNWSIIDENDRHSLNI